MDVKELAQLTVLPEDHWYYASKFELLSSVVAEMKAERIADVGAGSGVFARLLLSRTGCKEAVCVDPAYEREYDEEVGDKVLRFRWKLEAAPCDLVLLMDVLEHVDDDAGLLRDVAKAVAPGTPIFITVPAFKALWSAHDVFLDHRRRYTAAMLSDAVRRSGMRRVWVRYFYASILAPVALLRLLRRGRDSSAGSDLRSTPRWLDSLLRKVLRVERLLIFRSNVVAGLSVVCLARS